MLKITTNLSCYWFSDLVVLGAVLPWGPLLRGEEAAWGCCDIPGVAEGVCGVLSLGGVGAWWGGSNWWDTGVKLLPEPPGGVKCPPSLLCGAIKWGECTRPGCGTRPKAKHTTTVNNSHTYIKLKLEQCKGRQLLIVNNARHSNTCTYPEKSELSSWYNFQT